MGCYRQIQSYLLQSSGTFNNPASVYPVAVFLDSFSFPINLGIVGFSLTSTITVDSASPNICSILLVYNRNDAVLNVSQDSGIIGIQSSTPNTVSPTAFNPANQNTTIMFDDYGFPLKSGQFVSMYMMGFNVASSYQAFASLYTIPIK